MEVRTVADETARSEVEVWRLAHKVGAEYAAMFEDPRVPQVYRDGIAGYRDYVEKVVTQAGFEVPGPSDSIQDKPWPKADAYAIYSKWLAEGSRSGKSVWEAIEAAYEAGKASTACAPNPGGES
jgi:hypothetical protein